mgnify:CR=1 FL=1
MALSGFFGRVFGGGANNRQIFANIGWLFFDKILRMAGGLVVGVWIARYLGPTQYGTLNFAVALASLFTALSTLGLDSIIVRDVVREPDAHNEIVGTAAVLRFIAGVATIALIQVVASVMRPDQATARLLVAIVSLATVFRAADVLKPWFESQVASKYRVIAENSGFLVVTGLRVALILVQAPLYAFGMAMAIEVMLGKAALWVVYARKSGRIRDLRVRWRWVVHFLAEGWPLILSSLAVMMYMRIDQIMLGMLLDDTAVGVYSAAVKISEIWYFIPMSIVASFAPRLTQLHKSDRTAYDQRFQRLCSSLTAISYLVVVPVAVLAPWAMTLLYGAEYGDAGIVLTLHIWAGLFVSLGIASARWLLNEGMTRFTLVRTVAGVVVNIGLNAILIPRYGPAGAAFTTVISHSVSDMLAHVTIGRARPLFKMQARALLLWQLRSVGAA